DVAIIDAASKTVLATVKIGKGPGFPMFSPDSTRLYVMESGMGDLVVIDLKTMSVSARYKVGTDPFGGGVRITRCLGTEQITEPDGWALQINNKPSRAR